MEGKSRGPLMTEPSFTEHTVALHSGPVTYLKGGEGRPILHLHSAGGPRRVSCNPSMLARRHIDLHARPRPGYNGTPEHPAVGLDGRPSRSGGEIRAAAVVGGPCDVIRRNRSAAGRRCGWRRATPTSVGQLVLAGAGGAAERKTGGLARRPGRAAAQALRRARARAEGDPRCRDAGGEPAPARPATPAASPSIRRCRRRCPASRRAR